MTNLFNILFQYFVDENSCPFRFTESSIKYTPFCRQIAATLLYLFPSIYKISLAISYVHLHALKSIEIVVY